MLCNSDTPSNGPMVKLNWGRKPDGTSSGLTGVAEWTDAQHVERRVGIDTSHPKGVIYIYTTTTKATDFMRAVKSIYTGFELFVKWEPARAH